MYFGVSTALGGKELAQASCESDDPTGVYHRALFLLQEVLAEKNYDGVQP